MMAFIMTITTIIKASIPSPKNHEAIEAPIKIRTRRSVNWENRIIKGFLPLVWVNWLGPY